MNTVRFALRTFSRTPGASAVAILCLALAIGATSAMFSLIDGYYLRPLPVRNAGELVRISTVTERGAGRVSYPDYLDYRRAAGLAGALAVERRGPILSGDGPSESSATEVVTDNYFTVLGVNAERGRVFTAGASNDAVVVISHNLWQRRYGGDPAMVGRRIVLNERPLAVIGIAPRGFRGDELSRNPDLWVPMSTWKAVIEADAGQRRDYRGYNMIARLAPGVAPAQAEAELNAIAQNLAQAWPATNRGARAMVTPGLQATGTEPWIVLAIAGLVLAIACGNVANLLLARGEARRSEIALRLALGASRWRLVRQLLAESAVLGALGTAAGLLLAAWLIRLLPALVLPPSHYRTGYEFLLDGRSLAFTLSAALLTTFVFGLIPALQASRPAIAQALKPGRVHLRDLLVVGQVAVSLVLLASAGLLVRSFLAAQRVDLGVERKHVLLAEVGGRQSFFEEASRRLAALPGVRQVTYGARPPLYPSGGGRSSRVVVPNQPDPVEIKCNVVAPGYFQVMGVRLLRGRVFDARDSAVVVISRFMARQYWPNEDPLGRVIRVDKDDRQIVGIVDDVKINSIEERLEPYLYLPARGGFQILMVETAADPQPLAQQVRSELAAIDKRAVVTGVWTMRSLIRNAVYNRERSAVLVGILGFLGLLLAAVGLYGVMSYAVARRTREIGIRMALGAQRGATLRLVMRGGLRLALTGSALGLAGALWATQALASRLYQVSPRDPLTFASAALVMLGVALAASYLPARRASKVDPAITLRYE